LPTFKALLIKLEENNIGEEHHKITKNEKEERVDWKKIIEEGENSVDAENIKDIPSQIMILFCRNAIKKMELPDNLEHLADMNNEKFGEAFREFTGEDYEPELKNGQLMEAQMLENVAAVKLLLDYIEDHRLYVGEFQKMAKKAAEAELKNKKETEAGQSTI